MTLISLFNIYTMQGKLKILKTTGLKKLHTFTILWTFYDFVDRKHPMFDWGVLKHGVPGLQQFCIGNLTMYTVLIPTLSYYFLWEDCTKKWFANSHYFLLFFTPILISMHN